MISGISLGLLGSLSPALPADRLWLNTVAPIALDHAYASFPYRVDLAQMIRDNAGLQGGVTVGIETGETVGIINESVLALDATLSITEEVSASFVASSGTGTEEDPYIIRDLESINQSVNRCLRINDPDADYYLKFINCRWAGGIQAEIQIVAWPTDNTIIFENCEIYDDNSTGNEGIAISAGSAIFRNCLFSGDGGTNIIRFNSASMSGSFLFENCKLTDDNQSLALGNFIAPVFSNTIDLTLRHCEIDVALGTGGNILDLTKGVNSLLVENCKFTGMLSLFNVDDAASGKLDGAIIRNCHCIDQAAEHIYHNYLHNSIVEHCEFEHNTQGANKRQVFFTGDNTPRAVGPVGNIVRNCKFTKQTGTLDTAGNECLETERGKNNRFIGCWVTECTEDAFEHITSIGGNTVEYCVGDNVQGQIADIWKSWKESTWTLIEDTSLEPAVNIYVHHIYGDCKSIGCTADAYRGGIYHDIYIDNTASTNSSNGSVTIRSRDGTDPMEIYVAGPLPLAADRKNNAVEIGLDAVSCEARFFDNETGTGTITIVSSSS